MVIAEMMFFLDSIIQLLFVSQQATVSGIASPTVVIPTGES